jgi:gluconate 2-dehydrogenase alpha chain
VTGRNLVAGNASLDRFDVIVIGSGAGGSVVACMLASHGLRTLVLEAGPNHFEGLDDPTRLPRAAFGSDELKLEGRDFLGPHSSVDPRTFRASADDGPRTHVGNVNGLPKTVGGGGVHADLKMPRFRPSDLRLGTLLGDVPGATFADWPVDYDMLEPWYVHCERLQGIQGTAGADPFEGPRSAPLPMPPGVPMWVALKVAEAATALGYHPFPYPTAVNSQPYDGRPACVDCGFCSGYGCPSHAKGSTAITGLRRALLGGHCLLRAETKVTRLLMNASGTEVTGVEALGPDGQPETYRADRYVLAASPIEDARLCFLSDREGDGVGNSSGMVGRNLTFHFQTNGIGIFEERMHGHRGRTVTHGFSDFRGVPGDPDRPLGGIVELSGSSGPIFEASIYRQAMSFLRSFDGPRFKRLMRQSPFRDRVVALAMQAEDAPQASNRVDLDPDVRDLDGLPVARVTYANHRFELDAREHYAPMMLELLRASGARWGGILPIDEIPASAHIHGTLRSGDDPATSVCDAGGRFHDVGNLWAGDGSLFPTSSGFNPTLTITALAARVAAGIVFPGSPERALDD